MVSDFLLPGETPYEAVDSVREVFGFYPSIDTMDDDLEMVASPQQMVSQTYFGICNLMLLKSHTIYGECKTLSRHKLERRALI